VKQIYFYSVVLLISIIFCGCQDNSKISDTDANCRDLSITFEEDKFHIKEDDEFDVLGAVESTNGEIESVNSVLYKYKKGIYEINYRVYCKEDKNIYKDYTMKLTVD
jgi:hypothetical protein